MIKMQLLLSTVMLGDLKVHHRFKKTLVASYKESSGIGRQLLLPSHFYTKFNLLIPLTSIFLKCRANLILNNIPRDRDVLCIQVFVRNNKSKFQAL
jgi:hypothetical protein